VGIAMRPAMLDWHTINSLIVSVYAELSAQGLTPLIVDAEQMVPGKSFAPFPSPDMLAGIISVDLAMEKEVPTFYKVLGARLPMVALYPVRSRQIDFVTSDRARGIELAVEHLLSLGHRDIALAEIEGSTLLTVQEKLNGWNRICRKNNLNPERIIPLQAETNASERARFIVGILRAMPSPPTALVCAGDDVALWTMHFLAQAGWEVGRDISLVGFDDVKQAEYSSPALTTIRQPVAQITQLAVERLKQLIEATRRDEALPPLRRLVEPQLMIRASSTQPVKPD
jgi:DNA-binding LacI/PurR family transcriptional regulator